MARERQAGPADGGRRHLLRLFGAAGGVAAVGAVAEAGTAERATLPGAKENAAERTKARYRPDAPDVQAFYRVNRY